MDEALRLLQAQQFYEVHGEVCPANWQPGEEGMGSTPETSKAYFSQQSEFVSGGWRWVGGHQPSGLQ